MNKFLITGGKPLKGEVKLCGAKNSGFKLMIAALYADFPSTIHNFSKIGDIYTTAEIIQELGGKVAFGENHQLEVTAKNLQKQEFSAKAGELSRASTYFIGPLLHRFGRAVLPIPGGCKIGRRPVDRHLDGIRALGGKITTSQDHYVITAKELHGTNFRFNKNTHGGTDIMLIAAAMAKGKTVLENAAQEPEVDDLIAFLNLMGAKICRTEPRTIVIEGVRELKGADFNVMSDRNEAVTFACLALATHGDVLVQYAQEKYLTAFLEKVKEIGGGVEIDRNGIRFYYKKPLAATNVVTRPYPGFMTDWMSLWGVLMTQANGESIIHETIFENRFAFVEALRKMGAKIELFNPEVKDPGLFYEFNLEDDKPEYFHAARFFGPVGLKAINQEITDLRAGACLILASLIAQGQSELTGIERVDRGYENLDSRLRSLGAAIKRIE